MITIADKKNTVHPYYNHAYNRYDLDIEDIIAGLKEAGYDIGGEGGGGNSGDSGDLPEEELDPSYQIVMFNTNGTKCNTTSFNTVLYVRLYKNGIDITDSTPATNFKWIRISGNSEIAKREDAEWNLRFASGSKECPITREDVKRNSTFTCKYVEFEDQDVAYVKAAYNAYVKNANLNGGDN